MLNPSSSVNLRKIATLGPCPQPQDEPPVIAPSHTQQLWYRTVGSCKKIKVSPLEKIEHGPSEVEIIDVSLETSRTAGGSLHQV